MKQITTILYICYYIIVLYSPRSVEYYKYHIIIIIFYDYSKAIKHKIIQMA